MSGVNLDELCEMCSNLLFCGYDIICEIKFRASMEPF